MTSHLLIGCSCHTNLVNPSCNLLLDDSIRQIIECREVNILPELPREIDFITLEHFIDLEIICNECKIQARETIEKVMNEKIPTLTIHFKSPSSNKTATWSLSSSKNSDRRSLIAKPLFESEDWIVTEDQNIYSYLTGNSSSISPSEDDEIHQYVQSLILSCSEHSYHHDDIILENAKKIEEIFEAIAVGYNYLRVFSSASTIPIQHDLIWILNKTLQDQADFFVSVADYVKMVSSNEKELPVARVQLKIKLNECFSKSLQIFDEKREEGKEIWMAYRYGRKLWNREKTIENSFVYRKMKPLFPLSTLVSFFLKNQQMSISNCVKLRDLTLENARIFTESDSWKMFQEHAEILNPFSGGFVKDKSLQELRQYLNVMDNLLLQHNKIEHWFGIGTVPIPTLEETSRRFFETAIGEYRLNTHNFLINFIQEAHQIGVSERWDLIKSAIDSIFIMKIGMSSYGELDWILGRFHMIRYCRTTSGNNFCLSQVISRYLLSEEFLQTGQSTLPQKTNASSRTLRRNDTGLSEGGQLVKEMLEIVMDNNDTISSTSLPPPLTDLLSESKVDSYLEEWIEKLVCIVRTPSVFFGFITEGTILSELMKEYSVSIEVIQTGKILSSSSLFRFSGKARESIGHAVESFRNFIINAGLCQRRFCCSKQNIFNWKGAGKSDSLSSLRLTTNCKIFVSDVDAPPKMSWIVLLGNFSSVSKAAKLIEKHLKSSHSDDDPAAIFRRARSPIESKQNLLSEEFQIPRKIIPSPVQFLPSFSFSSESSEENKMKQLPVLDDKKRSDVLFKAIQHRDWITANELIEKNEGIEFVAPSGTTVLHKAAERNAPDYLVKSLITKGLDPNQPLLRKRFTPIHFAVQGNVKPSVLEVLIEAGGDVNSLDDQDSTPAHIGANRNVAPRLIEILIAHGAICSIKDKTGMTPFQIAVQSGASVELIELLRKNQ